MGTNNQFSDGAQDAADSDHVVLVLPRGERGENRWSRSRFKGATFTKAQLWYPGADGELRPGTKVITIRDSELDLVIEALTKIRNRIVNGPRRGSAAPPKPPEPAKDEYDDDEQKGLPF